MGTDIHAFVEVDYGPRFNIHDEPFGPASEARAFNEGEFFVWQHYDLFDALGDGRSNGFSSESERRKALFPPRGLPPRLSDGVFNRFYHPILPPEQSTPPTSSLYVLELPPVTPEDASQWVGGGRSHYYFDPAARAAGPATPTHVSHPDWHSASWLFLGEEYPALAHFGLPAEKLGVEVKVLLRAMEEFERQLGPGRTRLVFWFDN